MSPEHLVIEWVALKPDQPLKLIKSFTVRKIGAVLAQSDPAVVLATLATLGYVLLLDGREVSRGPICSIPTYGARTLPVPYRCESGMALLFRVTGIVAPGMKLPELWLFDERWEPVERIVVP